MAPRVSGQQAAPIGANCIRATNAITNPAKSDYDQLFLEKGNVWNFFVGRCCNKAPFINTTIK
jgi:hypothetical protein